MSTIEGQNIPTHLGIIMDGNGRWANARGLPRISGHHEGAKTVDRIVTACRKRGVRTLTLYAFSSQNWSRPLGEVKALMALLGEYVKTQRKKILDNDIRLLAIGALDRIPDAPRRALFDLMEASAENKGMTLCLALSYGGQEEIVEAARTLAMQVQQGNLKPDAIDVDLFSRSLWSKNLGPVDLVIRTSGELRLSNFLLFSCAYAELYFSDRMWPDFDETDLDRAFAAFAERHRRFGDLEK